jgi:ribosomal protein S18 acetylase RimI-like enzyme
MTLDLRRLTAADAAALRALRIEAFTLHPRDFRSAPEEEAARPIADLEATLARDTVMGLFDGETLAGAAGLRFEPRAKMAHHAEIWGVYVKAGHRGARAGERLLTALVDAARGKAEAIYLTVSDGNGPALRLYTRLGFEQWAVQPRTLKMADGTYVDEIAMVRRLNLS